MRSTHACARATNACNVIFVFHKKLVASSSDLPKNTLEFLENISEVLCIVKLPILVKTQVIGLTLATFNRHFTLKYLKLKSC